VYVCVYSGVVITPLVIHASRGNTRCHHSAVPAVTNNVASLRLSESAPDTRSSLSRTTCHHHHRHHPHHTMSSSALADNSSAVNGQLNTQVVIHPAYDSQLSLKRLRSTPEILPAASSKVTSIDAPLEQLSLPPPLIPVPSSQMTAVSKHVSAHRTPRRSLPSTPPPVPVRRSLGNIRETTSSTPAAVVAPVTDETSTTGDAASNECVVCLERAPDSVLYTCGHMCMCYVCACNVLQSHDPLCPICRQSILDVIKIFRS